jgi:hypothetical protein
MDEFNDNEIARLLRLKRYEQPPPGYFENFLHEFHRRHLPGTRSQFHVAAGYAITRVVSHCGCRIACLRSYLLIKGLSATRDGSRRHSESVNFIGTGEYRARMEPCISGRHADFQDAAGSQFS